MFWIIKIIRLSKQRILFFSWLTESEWYLLTFIWVKVFHFNLKKAIHFIHYLTLKLNFRVNSYNKFNTWKSKSQEESETKGAKPVEWKSALPTGKSSWLPNSSTNFQKATKQCPNTQRNRHGEILFRFLKIKQKKLAICFLTRCLKMKWTWSLKLSSKKNLMTPLIMNTKNCFLETKNNSLFTLNSRTWFHTLKNIDCRKALTQLWDRSRNLQRHYLN